MDTSYLTQQVNSIIGQLQNLFDEIGVPHHERESRESEVFSSLSETLHNHLKVVTGEKNEIHDECKRIMTTIRQMEASLEDAHTNPHYAPLKDELQITYPLLECLQMLKSKHKEISKLHKERYDQVKKLVQALESYSSHLESSFVKIKLPPISESACPPTFDLSPSYIDSVDQEFSRVYDEYGRRVALVQQLGEEVVSLWAELGTPQAQTDSAIVRHWRDSPEQLGLHKDDVDRLHARRDRLLEEKRGRERKLNQLRAEVEGLWDRLGVEDQDRKAFLASNRGCGLRAINDLEDELSRLNELKRQNLHLFVEDARNKLQALWDELYFSEEEAVEFTPMFSDIYSDALLSAHETEISRLEALKDQRAPTLSMIAKHRSLLKDKGDLESSSHDASRLMMKGAKGEKRDPGKLLREEKMRKRIARELPKVEQELRKVLESWEDEYGRPFLVFGEHYLEALSTSTSKAPPPRSKTPNALPPRPASQAATKHNTRSATSTQRIPPGRDASSAAPSRSKTPAPGTGTLRGNPMASMAKPVAASGNIKSPSRIPARVPLGVTSGNSPERKSPSKPSHGTSVAASSVLRGPKSGPMMAPPPKMRDLRPQPPTPSTTASSNLQDVLRSGSVVRPIQPEDPYAPSSDYSRDHSNAPLMQRQQPSRQPHQPYDAMPPPPRPYQGHQYSYSSSAPSLTNTTSSRVPSADSTAPSSNGNANGSENWETYGSDDEDETAQPRYDQDPHAQYRHKQQAYGFDTPYDAKISATQMKRSYPDDVDVSAGKKMRGLHDGHTATTVFDKDGRIVSEASWTDDDIGSVF